MTTTTATTTTTTTTTTGLTATQVRWASQHDWYVATTKKGSTYTVYAKDYDSSGLPVVLEFEDYQELRGWAGY